MKFPSTMETLTIANQGVLNDNLKVLNDENSMIDMTVTNCDDENNQVSVIKVSPLKANKPNKGFIPDEKKKPYGGRPLRFQCMKCDRKFHAPSHLKRHLLCHSAERPFKCHICKKGFLQAWHLGRHLTTHTGNKPFNCSQCTKSFGSRFEMKTHYNYIHRGIKEHKCKICEKLFTLKSNLKVHMRKHTGEKPYHCHICSKRFGQRGHLQYHLKKHTAAVTSNWVIETKVSDCQIKIDTQMLSSKLARPILGKVMSKGDIEEDILKFQEKHDDKMFGNINKAMKLKRKKVSTTPLSGRIFDHINPTELKPFVCVTCNCGFGEISSLRAHVRHSHPKKHIVEGKYECAYCNKPFCDIHELHFHFQLHHGKKKDMPSPPLSPLMTVGTKRNYEEENNDLPPPRLRRTTSAIMFPQTVRSPSGFSTASDTTFDRQLSLKSFDFTSECKIPNCNCNVSKTSAIYFPKPDISKRPGQHAFETELPSLLKNIGNTDMLQRPQDAEHLQDLTSHPIKSELVKSLTKYSPKSEPLPTFPHFLTRKEILPCSPQHPPKTNIHKQYVYRLEQYQKLLESHMRLVKMLKYNHTKIDTQY